MSQRRAAYSMMCYVLSDGDKQVFPGVDGAAQATGACTLFCFFLSAFLCLLHVSESLDYICFSLWKLIFFFLVGVRRPMQEVCIFEDHVDDPQYHLCEYHENLKHD